MSEQPERLEQASVTPAEAAAWVVKTIGRALLLWIVVGAIVAFVVGAGTDAAAAGGAGTLAGTMAAGLYLTGKRTPR